MRKVTLSAFLMTLVISGVVFALTSIYYRSEYIPKRGVLIVTDTINSVDDSEAFPVKTVIMNDPTLVNKFVGNEVTDEVTEDKLDDFQIKKISGLKSESQAYENRINEASTLRQYSNNDNWARAGEPYIVPQMTDSQRNIKVKRFQQPTSGATNGH